jgi:glycosyltransferase involved in cell wall biosynthesis
MIEIKKNNKIKILWFITPFQPRYGVMNIVMGWAEKVDYTKYEISLACFSPDEKELLDKFSRFPDVKIVLLPDLSQIKYFFIPQMIALNKFLSMNSFDVIHTVFAQADIIGAILKRKYKIPVHVSSIMGQIISSVNGSKFVQKGKRTFYNLMYRKFCNNIDCFFPITSTSSKQLMTEFKIRAKKIVVIYSGVPMDIRPKGKYKNIHFTIGAASQLIPEKGLDILINALPEIHRIYPNANLIIAGEGPEKQNLLDQAKSLGVSANIQFLGFCKDMPEFMNNLDLFVFPARPSYDGLPRVILESMVQHTPVIASNTCEIREILTLNGANGNLFEVGDVQGLVNAIREMFKSAQNVKEITDRAFNMATSITVEENIKLIQNTYSELLDLSKQ